VTFATEDGAYIGETRIDPSRDYQPKAAAFDILTGSAIQDDLTEFNLHPQRYLPSRDSNRDM
jgi:hypothetical protein